MLPALIDAGLSPVWGDGEGEAMTVRAEKEMPWRFSMFPPTMSFLQKSDRWLKSTGACKGMSTFRSRGQ
jgi:hypothetical protein